MEKKVEIEWMGKKDEVVLKELDWGESNECTRKALSINYEGKRTVDFVLQEEYKLLKSITKAPFPYSNIDELRKIPKKLGDQLFKEMQILNGVTGDVEKN